MNCILKVYIDNIVQYHIINFFYDLFVNIKFRAGFYKGRAWIKFNLRVTLFQKSYFEIDSKLMNWDSNLIQKDKSNSSGLIVFEFEFG